MDIILPYLRFFHESGNSGCLEYSLEYSWVSGIFSSGIFRPAYCLDWLNIRSKLQFFMLNFIKSSTMKNPMTAYQSLSKTQLIDINAQLDDKIQTIREQQLNLDMTRGKPSNSQLDLSLPMLNIIDADNYNAQGNVDCRNYGGLDGLVEAKQFFAEYLGVTEQEIIIGGNASLNMMHDAMSIAMLHGTTDDGPWFKQEEVNFLCPVPGYDRHFAICEHLGIKMIPVAMTQDGPDMDRVEALVKDDATIKGIWCVPKYSNPTGICYSKAIVERLAEMTTAAKGFRIFWDNAYTVHHLGNGIAEIEHILDACRRVGNEDRVYIFGSTSKLTFPGSGVAMMAGSEKNMAFFRNHLSFQTIGPDKLNQLRHLLFLKDKQGLLEHMSKHAILMKARFDAVQDVLDNQLSGKAVAQWSKPEGGYFIDLDALPGTAKEVVSMASQLGVKLTPAGAPFPYGNDPEDKNIRIAPSFPSVDEVTKASEVLCVCIEKVSVNQLLKSVEG